MARVMRYANYPRCKRCKRRGTVRSAGWQNWCIQCGAFWYGRGGTR